MKVAIKNMVCPRCTQAVSQVFASMAITPLDVRLGEVILADPLTPKQQQTLQKRLTAIGFELLDNQQHQLVEKIKAIVIEHVHRQEADHFVFTDVLPAVLNKEYSQDRKSTRL